MDANFVWLPTMDKLRLHVHWTMRAPDLIDPNQAPMKEAVIQRRGKPCGLFFQVQGPRQVRTYALWVEAENRILFYDGTGLRFAETRLSEAPDVGKVAA